MVNVKIVCRALIFDSQGRVLIIKNSGSDFWCLPGGNLESFDDSVQECIVRELNEELGSSATVEKIRFVQELIRNNVRYVELIWQVNLASDPVANRERIQEISNGELLDIQWADKDELQKIDIKPEFLKQVV